MTETAATFPNIDMPIITDLGTERPKTDAEMTCLDKNNINEAIRQKLRNKDVYESDIQNIYNISVVQKNEQLQEKEVPDVTFQVVKTDQDPIGYLMILKGLCF